MGNSCGPSSRDRTRSSTMTNGQDCKSPSATNRSCSERKSSHLDSARPSSLLVPSQSKDDLSDNGSSCSRTPHLAKETNTVTVQRTSDRKSKKQINQYVSVKTLGRGNFGVVKMVKSISDNTRYAMKKMDKARLLKPRLVGRFRFTSHMESVKKEIAIMKKLDHPNVVKLYEVIDSPDSTSIFLVMEYVDRGAIMDSAPTHKPLGEKTARKYFRDLILGLEYLHFNHVIHRDIKPENLLVTKEGNVKIGDFGVSITYEDSDKLTSTEGTPAFMAPEMCSPASKEFSGRMADIWACGVTLYVFVFGRVPFLASTTSAVFQAITEQPVTFPRDPGRQLGDLLRRILDKNPKTRITLPQIRVHPWVTQNGKNPLPPPVNQDKIMVTEQEVNNAFSSLSIYSVIRLKSRLRKVRSKIQLMHSGSASSLDGLSSPSTSNFQSPTNANFNVGSLNPNPIPATISALNLQVPANRPSSNSIQAGTASISFSSTNSNKTSYSNIQPPNGATYSSYGYLVPAVAATADEYGSDGASRYTDGASRATENDTGTSRALTSSAPGSPRSNLLMPGTPESALSNLAISTTTSPMAMTSSRTCPDFSSQSASAAIMDKLSPNPPTCVRSFSTSPSVSPQVLAGLRDDSTKDEKSGTSGAHVRTHSQASVSTREHDDSVSPAGGHRRVCTGVRASSVFVGLIGSREGSSNTLNSYMATAQTDAHAGEHKDAHAGEHKEPLMPAPVGVVGAPSPSQAHGVGVSANTAVPASSLQSTAIQSSTVTAVCVCISQPTMSSSNSGVGPAGGSGAAQSVVPCGSSSSVSSSSSSSASASCCSSSSTSSQSSSSLPPSSSSSSSPSPSSCVVTPPPSSATSPAAVSSCQPGSMPISKDTKCVSDKDKDRPVMVSLLDVAKASSVLGGSTSSLCSSDGKSSASCPVLNPSDSRNTIQSSNSSSTNCCHER